jgi:uncharacterized membrane protein YbhN (UPF0104 family)
VQPGRRRLTKLGTPAAQAMFGVACVLAGIVLFIACVGIATNSYDERVNPWWLTSLFVLAIALGLAGLGLVVTAAVRGSRAVRRAGG